MADIIHRIGIKAPAANVYEALATTQGVAGWWTRDTTGTAKQGGKVKVRFQRALGRQPSAAKPGQMLRNGYSGP